MQLFDMCSDDMDNFRDFINSGGFTDIFDLAADRQAAPMADADNLLRFAARFLKQVLLRELTIPLKAAGRERRSERRREHERGAGQDG